MIRFFFIILIVSWSIGLRGQQFSLEREKASASYVQAKQKLAAKLNKTRAGEFGEFIPGIVQKLNTSGKIIAFTFDACGGPKGSDYDKDLIDFLKQEKIPATLFISGPWLEKNPIIFQQLCNEPLFEIENHGLTHRPFTIAGEVKYKISGTKNFSEAYDEVELAARQIQFYNHRKPKYYRPGTATADEGAMAIASELGVSVIGYSVLSNDAMAGSSKELIKASILNKVQPGAIVIMHMNHPERNGFEALREVIPILKKQGYHFVTLEKYLK